MSGSDMEVNFQNLAKYSSEPEVQKAMKRLENVMQKIGISDEEGDDDEGDTGSENEGEYEE
jgi:ribosome assembly protein YihI (activator of Der GTPase)